MSNDDANKCCRMCGNKSATKACSACKDAHYCSVACQRVDWKSGGHKALCKGPASNRKIHCILRELFAAEYEWIANLSLSEKRGFFEEGVLDYPPDHLCHAGMVALVLVRANACAPLSSPFCKPSFGAALYSNVISPWYDRHRQFLNEEGFYIDQIAHNVLFSDIVRRTLGGDTASVIARRFVSRGVALIKDTKSPLINLVDKVFTNNRSARDIVAFKDITKCTHFEQLQVHEGTETATASGDVYYVFGFPRQVYRDPDKEFSPCFHLHFLVDPDNANDMGEHFYKSRKSMEKIGFPIRLHIENKDNWPDSALQAAYSAAVGDDGIMI